MDSMDVIDIFCLFFQGDTAGDGQMDNLKMRRMVKVRNGWSLTADLVKLFFAKIPSVVSSCRGCHCISSCYICCVLIITEFDNSYFDKIIVFVIVIAH